MTPFPYENPLEPESLNINADRLARVVELFQSQQSSGSFPGGQLVLRHHGKLVLNKAIGIARGIRPSESISPVPVNSQTPFPCTRIG